MRVLTEGSSEQLESFEIGCIVLGIIWCLIAYGAVILQQAFEVVFGWWDLCYFSFGGDDAGLSRSLDVSAAGCASNG